jgi:uncharacterized membrane protein YhaH (DUF805 family)
MTKPYQPPLSPILAITDDQQLRQRRKFWLRTIWLLIAIVILPPMFGLTGTAIRMIGAFGEMSNTGKADPEALASDISQSLLRAAWSLLISFLALLGLIGSLIRFFTLPKLQRHPSNEPKAQ